MLVTRCWGRENREVVSDLQAEKILEICFTMI
jgi:hypothetical protein